MNVNILGTGCPSCRIMDYEVTKIVVRNQMDAEMEYIQRISNYGN